jgi:DNA-binding SARP family transcriptional activator
VRDDGVEVAVLGPALVRGADSSFHRAAALELVVYLAFHRGGVRHAEWAQAIWPDRPVTLATVHSTASDARRALGAAANGVAHLPRGGRLRLGEAVTTDVEQFADLAAGTDDPGRLGQAFALVRGPLFAGLQRADWAVLDGTQSELEALVVGAALRGVEACLARALVREAEWMVRRALLVSPYDERLYRALLRVTAAHGNRVGLRAAMTELLTMAGEGRGGAGGPHLPRGPLDGLHPETTSLYRALLAGPPAAGGQPARL